MFSSALKSFTSNISSNYTLSSSPTSISGPWKIYDAKKKSTGKPASVFIFEKKSLEPQSGGLGGRSSGSSLKRAHEEVVERLKREASSLARLRHPSILELVEPVEETRYGGLMFATEPVTASLAGLLHEKDEQERAGGIGGRTSRYVIEEGDGKGRRRREIEIDELEIQKGLLQIGKGLEFLHESAGLVHGNLTPDAIFINAKSDWKISGLGFSGASNNPTTPASAPPISLSELLIYDPRLPHFTQLDIDYASPDFILDSNVTPAADMFSLGLLIIALYNSPHKSPIETNHSISTYKRLFSSSSSVPTQNNNFMSSKPLPKVAADLLQRLITRRPAQRLNAREFQQAQYFDNILVSTIRFLDSLPAKTPSEKSQFMRGLPRVIHQFPKSVLEKKLLPGLLEELKDRELISLVLQNVFKIITTLPSGKRAFGEKVIPHFRETFLTGTGGGGKSHPAAERDSAKEAGLMVLLENMKVVAENSTGKEFKDDILPIIYLALESPTNSLQDASLKSLPIVLPVLDFSTVKHELFPVVATVFAKTNSLGIKIRGCEALQTLCGGTPGKNADSSDGLDGIADAEKAKSKHSSSAILDKYTIQEKVVPLLKAIKTKEPTVMMAALEVFTEIGKIADSEFLAMDVLPILWQFSLGPLLNLKQFQAFMTLTKSLSARIEQEQTRKLQELSTSNTATTPRSNDFGSFGPVDSSSGIGGTANGEETDFESLVLGKKSSATPEISNDGWDSMTTSKPSSSRTSPFQQQARTPTFSWSTPSVAPSQHSRTLTPQGSGSRAITPDQALKAFNPLQPTPTVSSSFNQPLQPVRPGMGVLSPSASTPSTSTTHSTPINWSAATSTSNIWASSMAQRTPSTSSLPMHQIAQNQSSLQHSSFSTAPPASPYTNFGIAPPPSTNQTHQEIQTRPTGQVGQPAAFGGMTLGGLRQQAPGPKQGLDKYESLL